MIFFFSGMSRAVLRVCALFLCIFCASFGAPSTAHSGMIPPVLRTPSVSLLPDLQYFIDVTGTMDVEEAAAPANSQMFKPLNVKALPRLAGVMWLRFTLAPLPAGGRSQAILLDMGPDVPADPVLYQPSPSPIADSIEWREIQPTQRNVLLLPEPGAEAITCYIRLDGLPGIWFSPTLRTPQDAATNWGSLSGTAALLALGVVMLLCLLRGLSERGQWRVWTALYVGVALIQGTLGMPAYGTGHITLNQAMAVLAPGLALMLLPHVGRHLMRTRGRSPLLDAQFVLLSLPGAALALLPLLPGFGWSIRYLSLWPACTLIFTLSALGSAIMGLGGARRFLLGCLVPPLFVAAGIMGLDYGYAANLLASAPLWGTALSALLIAGTGLPRDAAQSDSAKADAQKTEPGKGKKRESAAAAKRNIAGLDAALVSSSLGDSPITLDAPLDDPNLRLLPPSAAGKTAADFSALPVDISDNADPAPFAARAPKQGAAAASVSPGMWENLLRPPLDRLIREGAALGHCSLPPAVRQYAENMINAAGDLAKILDNPGEMQEQSGVGEQRAPFNLQHLVREAHDAVTSAAENAGIGLAWYMPPLLGHMYEGQARALRETLSLLLESAVRATSRGAVHLSVRRVPETADPGHLLFTVTDSGAGIPPRDRSTLALTRAWELAGSNNGYLNVECGPQGTSIAFTLRLKPLENTADTDKTTAQARGPHIAVVAESAVDRQALAHMITNLGCNSTESRSMREALQCNREAPALMLVVQYPHHGPTEADALGRFEAEALETGLPVFKALAITKDDKQWDALAETGYTHALLDPVDAEAFAATLNEVLTEGGFLGGSPASPTAEGTAAPVMPDQAEMALAAAAVGSAVAGFGAETAAVAEDTPPQQPVDISLDAPETAAAAPLRMDAPAQAPTPNDLPDLFGDDAPSQGSLLPNLPQHDHAVAAPAPDVQMPLPHEEPLSFGAQQQPVMPHEAMDADPRGGMLLPLMGDAPQDNDPQEDDQDPIELTELLPEKDMSGETDQLLPSMTEEAEPALPGVLTEAVPATESDTLPDIQIEAEDPPAAAPLAEPLWDILPEEKAGQISEPEAAVLPEPADPTEPAAQSAPAADEFMASAGLEGPHWAAEDTVAAAETDSRTTATESPEITSETADDAVLAATTEHEANAPDAAQATAFEPLEWPESAPNELANEEPAQVEPAPTGSVLPEAAQSELELSESALSDGQATDAKAKVTPAEFFGASFPAEEPFAEPATETVEALAAPAEEVLTAQDITPLKSMSDRVGEAILTPVNATASFAESLADTADDKAVGKGNGFDVPAPAGRGAWDNYSLHEEWVGEPMPIGTPVPTARMAAPVQGTAPAALQAPESAATATFARQEKKSYVSPSLAHPGEWVGEPMPMTKPARQEEPAAPQQSAEAQPDDRRNRPVEMPRTATGRMILKLLGSAGDRPLDGDKTPAPSGKPDLLADLAAMPEQDSVSAPAPAPTPETSTTTAEPRRAATALKPSGKGNSIMNFIAGAAEALRHTDHNDAPQPAPKVEPVKAAEAPFAASQPAEAAQAASPASVPPAALVAPNAPRETDQTIPQLVARLDTAMDDAQQGFKNRRCAVVGEAANRIATESDAFGFRVLARMARCVERAAKANDMNALRDLLPELAVAVERNRIGLTPRR